MLQVDAGTQVTSLPPDAAITQQTSPLLQSVFSSQVISVPPAKSNARTAQSPAGPQLSVTVKGETPERVSQQTAYATSPRTHVSEDLHASDQRQSWAI